MSARRGHWALCRSRVVAFGKIPGLRVSVAVSPHAGATKTPLKVGLNTRVYDMPDQIPTMRGDCVYTLYTLYTLYTPGFGTCHATIHTQNKTSCTADRKTPMEAPGRGGMNHGGQGNVLHGMCQVCSEWSVTQPIPNPCLA